MGNLDIYHKTAGCFLVRNSGKPELLLLYCRWATGTEGYVPPKGHIEEDETDEQAAIREVREETGYKDIKIIRKLGDVNFEFDADDGSRHKKTITWFHGELISDLQDSINLQEGESSTIQRVDWVDLTKARNLIQFDDTRQFVNDLLRYYNVDNE